METRREEVLKVLQMLEEGKIDQNKALTMLAIGMATGPGR